MSDYPFVEIEFNYRGYSGTARIIGADWAEIAAETVRKFVDGLSVSTEASASPLPLQDPEGLGE